MMANTAAREITIVAPRKQHVRASLIATCATRPKLRFISQLTRHTFAVILAGGRGSRLKQLTDFRSKPAVPFAGKFRIIDFTLSNCVNSGIRKIGVATQYKAHSLIRHIQRGWSFLDGRFGEFIQLLPAQQQIDENQWYQGTADAVYQNLNFLRHNSPRHILIVAGDHIYKMDYGRMLAFHARHQADMSVACIDVPIAEAREFGVMNVDDDGRVIDFVEKPAESAAHARQPGAGPGLDGRLYLQRRLSLRAAPAATPRPPVRAATSVRTSFPTSFRAIGCSPTALPNPPWAANSINPTGEM
jgi:choline kinase